MRDADPFDPACVARADAALFHRRGDPNDVRLGETVARDPAAYARADAVLLGCPQDEGVRRNRGRPGAALAPAAIRRALYRLSVNGLDALRLFDLGDTVIQPALEETQALHRRIVSRVARDGKRLIVLGGGNDVAYPDCAGLAEAAGPVLAFNVDAHLDARADPIPNSGTPYRQLLDEGWVEPAALWELGWQPFANSPVYLQRLRQAGVELRSLEEWRRAGIEAVLREALARHAGRSAFWGIDMDAVRASDAPGVSAPNPTGLSGEELCRVAAIAGAHPASRLFEISEVNPAFDADDRASRLAAVAVYHFLAALAAGGLA
jgi:formiminoglutamase